MANRGLGWAFPTKNGMILVVAVTGWGLDPRCLFVCLFHEAFA